jgi:hypothetical protein
MRRVVLQRRMISGSIRQPTLEALSDRRIRTHCQQAICYHKFTSLPSAHDLGGENPYIDTKDVFEASELWATRPSGCWSPLERAPRGEKLPKDCPTAEVLLEAKAAALHPKRYQSSLSKLSTKREGEAGKEAQAMGLASQSDGQKSDGQTDRQVETRPMSAGTQADRAAS